MKRRITMAVVIACGLAVQAHGGAMAGSRYLSEIPKPFRGSWCAPTDGEMYFRPRDRVNSVASCDNFVIEVDRAGYIVEEAGCRAVSITPEGRQHLTIRFECKDAWGSPPTVSDEEWSLEGRALRVRKR